MKFTGKQSKQSVLKALMIFLFICLLSFTSASYSDNTYGNIVPSSGTFLTAGANYSINTNYSTSSGNADTVDSKHASEFLWLNQTTPQTITGNLNVTGTGFFSALGSMLNWISNLFVSNITATNINTTNITISQLKIYYNGSDYIIE